VSERKASFAGRFSRIIKKFYLQFTVICFGFYDGMLRFQYQKKSVFDIEKEGMT